MRVTRRLTLMAAAASVLGMSGCGLLPSANWAKGRQSASAAGGLTLSMPPLVQSQSAQAALSQRYHTLHPDVTVTWTGWNGGPVPKWAIYPIVAAGGVVGPGMEAVDLGPALRARNAEAPSFLPGALDSFTVGGSVYALPLWLSPQGIRYNPAAIGISPSPDWTISDFENACAKVKSALDAGKLQGVSGVLPLLLGHTWCPGRPGTARMCAQGELESSLKWLPVVQGLGGWVYRDGSFDLTNAGALQAFFTLIDWQRRFGPPVRMDFDSTQAMYQYILSTAVGFWPDEIPEAGAKFQLAPFFNMPHASPIGVRLVGIGVVTAGDVVPPDAQLNAFVDFMLWLYRPEQQVILAGAGLTPVIKDASLQDDFWAHRYQYPGVVPRGGWRRFAPTDLGLPVRAPLDNFVSTVLAKYADPNADVHGLQDDLQRATDTLNEWAQRNSSNGVVGV